MYNSEKPYLYERFDAIPRFIPRLINAVAKATDFQMDAAALRILSSYFLSMEFAGVVQHNLDFSLLPSFLPQLVIFIRRSAYLPYSIITLSSAINIMRAPFGVMAVVPLLPTILDIGISTDDSHLTSGIVGLLLALAKEPGVDLNILLGEKVITFLQLIRSVNSISPYINPLLYILYTHHDPTIDEYHKKSNTTVLGNFLNKSGAPITKYIMALVSGDAISAIFIYFTTTDDNIHDNNFALLYRLSFFGAEKLLDYPGSPAHILTNLVAKHQPLRALAIIWTISLRKTIRKVLPEGERKLMYDFAVEFEVDENASKDTRMLKRAVMFNLESPGMHLLTLFYMIVFYSDVFLDDGDSDGETTEPSSADAPQQAEELPFTEQQIITSISKKKKQKKKKTTKKEKNKGAVQPNVDSESTEIIHALTRSIPSITVLLFFFFLFAFLCLMSLIYCMVSSNV